MNSAKSAAPQRKQPSTAAPADFAKPPLRPHPKLFIVLCVLFALWLLVLLILFFTTVYPFRHSLTTTQPLP
jgi:hypothetical protein